MNQYSSVDVMFVAMLKEAMQHGSVPSRNGEMHECLGWTGTVATPRARRVTHEGRNVRSGYPQASVAWNLAEKNDVESICWWNSNGRKISDDGLTFYGANYGERWSPYLDEALYLLQTEPETRRAWVPIWKPEDLVDQNVEIQTSFFDPDKIRYSRKGKDVPCTLGFGLNIRREKLNMQVVMRSQAVWGVFPYDFYLFSVMHELIANEIEVDMGDLQWTCLSMHVFERELEHIAKMLNDIGLPSMKGLDDPIKLKLSEAKVKYPSVFQMTMAGHPIDTYGEDLSGDPVVQGMIEGAAQIRRANEDDGA